MQHKGEIIKKVIDESGYSKTRLAKRMGKSRRWIYQVFENPNVPVDYVLAIGKIIHHDFSDDIKELKTYKLKMVEQLTHEPSQSFDSDREEAEYWKNKYLLALEKYTEVLTSSK